MANQERQPDRHGLKGLNMRNFVCLVSMLMVGCSLNASGLQVFSQANDQVVVEPTSAPDAAVPPDMRPSANEVSQMGPEVTSSKPDAGSIPDLVSTKSPDVWAVADVLPSSPDLSPVGQLDDRGPDLRVVSPDVMPDVVVVPDVVVPNDMKVVVTPDAWIPDTLQYGLKPDVVAPASTVTFANGSAAGAMTGKGWVTSGDWDMVTSPTCNTAKGTSNECPAPGWSSSFALCVSGDVMIVSSAMEAANWGMEIGVNAAPTSGSAIGVAYSSIVANFGGCIVVPGKACGQGQQADLRLVLHVAGDAASTTYCQDGVTSGTTYAFAGFTTNCGGTGGTSFNVANASQIDWVGLEIVASTSDTFEVTNFCLNSLAFGQ
jgi:hypothetical protein